MNGLAKVEPATSDTLIAFATKPGFTADDGRGANSPFTAALLKNLTVPGRDIRIALGFTRDEVLKATRRRQEPFVSGSLGGATVALVPEKKEPEPKREIAVQPRSAAAGRRRSAARLRIRRARRHPRGVGFVPVGSSAPVSMRIWRARSATSLRRPRVPPASCRRCRRRRWPRSIRRQRSPRPRISRCCRRRAPTSRPSGRPRLLRLPRRSQPISRCCRRPAPAGAAAAGAGCKAGPRRDHPRPADRIAPRRLRCRSRRRQLVAEMARGHERFQSRAPARSSTSRSLRSMRSMR